MIPKQAIEKAIEGGWQPTIPHERMPTASIALDPTFWQALGKGCGWVEKHTPDHLECPDLECWCNIANIFTRIVLTDGDTEKFWKELLQ